jgi:CDP-glucose 4,6-dehydratase
VGLWLVRRLCESGANVVGFSRSEIRLGGVFSYSDFPERFHLVRGSLAEGSLLLNTIRERSVDTIFHLAAQSKVEGAQQAPRETFEANIQGTWNLLEAVRNVGMPVRTILASTDMVYGESSEGAQSEESPIKAVSPYAASKACADVLGWSYHRTYGAKICVARMSNLYGGGDFGFQRIIPGTIRAVLRGEAPVIKSNGLPERDYLYVEDAVRGYLLLATAMEQPEVCGQTFNFSSEAPVSVLNVVELILKLMGRTDLKPEVLGHGNETSIRRTSSFKARETLGWSADSTLESGLKKTIEWYQSHMEA